MRKLSPLFLIIAPGAVALALCVSATAASAATATASMSVTASVQATCTVSATGLSFGTYVSAQLDASTTLSVSCTNTTPYNIGLDVGTGTGATVSSRKMTSGAQTLTYSVYSDSGRATVWGPTIGTNTVTGTGNGSAQSFTVYGRIPSGQLPTPGSYSDTVTATVTY